MSSPANGRGLVYVIDTASLRVPHEHWVARRAKLHNAILTEKTLTGQPSAMKSMDLHTNDCGKYRSDGSYYAYGHHETISYITRPM